jgi:hypothetical protein
MNETDGPDGAYTEPVETALIGLGSIIMGDDGIGPHAVTALEVAWELPSEVELLERFGISPRRRGTQESQTIWWEK